MKCYNPFWAYCFKFLKKAFNCLINYILLVGYTDFLCDALLYRCFVVLNRMWRVGEPLLMTSSPARAPSVGVESPEAR